MSENKVENATREDADWSFVEDARVMKAVRSAAIKAANEFELVEYEDAEQDVVLYLAVRPEMVKAVQESEDFASFRQNLYANCLRPAAVRESDRNTATVYGIFDQDSEAVA